MNTKKIEENLCLISAKPYNRRVGLGVKERVEARVWEGSGRGEGAEGRGEVRVDGRKRCEFGEGRECVRLSLNCYLWFSGWVCVR